MGTDILYSFSQHLRSSIIILRTIRPILAIEISYSFKRNRSFSTNFRCPQYQRLPIGFRLRWGNNSNRLPTTIGRNVALILSGRLWFKSHFETLLQIQSRLHFSLWKLDLSNVIRGDFRSARQNPARTLSSIEKCRSIHQYRAARYI